MFLALKTTGTVRERAAGLARTAGVLATVAGGAFLLWTWLAHDTAWTVVPVGLTASALLGSLVMTARRREGWAFVLTAVAVVGVAGTLFGSLYPDVLPSTVDPRTNSLTTTNAASTPYTLTIMTWVAAVLTPVVLAYQAWTFWVFRRRIGHADIPAATGLPARPMRTGAP